MVNHFVAFIVENQAKNVKYQWKCMYFEVLALKDFNGKIYISLMTDQYFNGKVRGIPIEILSIEHSFMIMTLVYHRKYNVSGWFSVLSNLQAVGGIPPRFYAKTKVFPL